MSRLLVAGLLLIGALSCTFQEVVTPRLEVSLPPTGERSVLQPVDRSDPPFIVFETRAISNDRIRSAKMPESRGTIGELRITACPGEYEPASFIVYASGDVEELNIRVTDLSGERASIPSSHMDVFIVKSWYQAGRGITITNNRYLTPELLLRDESLVKVDHEERNNYLKTQDEDRYVLISDPEGNMPEVLPRDAETLQPVDIPALENRQFWLRAHVPETARPGDYEGFIELSSREVPSARIRLRLTVLPFLLEKPAIRYSLYYRGKINEEDEGSIGSEAKSLEQYEAEMRDLLAHGVDFPTLYQRYDTELLRKALTIREEVGLPKGPLYSLGIYTGKSRAEKALTSLKQRVGRWIEIAEEFGYDDVYVYGMDEAVGEELLAQRAAWEAVHEAGGKVFTAGFRGTFELVGDLLDLAVHAGRPDPNEAAKYSGAGHEIFCYLYPQVAPEQPETYRRNFGLLLWKAGYHGAMNYAYQHAFGHIWNDFDHRRYRDHVFAYPTVDGVIGTIQWEGFREAVDDVRYVTTLLRAIEATRERDPGAAAEAERWVAGIDTKSNLAELRSEMVDWIIKLRSLDR
jgi:hypothetical protein